MTHVALPIRMDQPRATRLVTVVATCLLAGCSTGGGIGGLSLDAAPIDVAGSDAGVARAKTTARAPDGKATLADLARAFAAKPDDQKAARRYARALKAAGKLNEAVAALDAVPDKTPLDRAFLVEHGLLAVEAGQAAKAHALLLKSEPEKTKDWRVLSGLGIAASGLGKQAEAQTYFQLALEVAPNNSTLLNNLALALILDNKAARGEDLLKRAAKGNSAQPKVAQNLVLAGALKAGSGTGDDTEPDTQTRRVADRVTTQPSGLTKAAPLKAASAAARRD